MMGDSDICVSQDLCNGRRNNCVCTEDDEKVFENSALDMFSMKMNSFRTAFETANAILRVHCIVCSSQ